ncbi:ATP-binding cassette domain-containing protein [Candidatus Sulfidibacterium hydrothermale]|uniref:ATP-binding cassette domain-containing protein n=1 Tax=Candidatus Sulfidibacterium hydrothermale TaxID=2875962 RepID=UPI001F0AE45A|nr:ATP-binding cassette domain-containing protein [Candidatus Sulfidibacterium hydrothermale]UBM62815.1 ATP-binding cassette domain-containing protein [Candidatus Sulfidibacterium hydrothermale]
MHSIEVKHIYKFYGSQKVLDDVCFQLDKGGVTGLLGPNGAGKSTLMKIITTFIPPYSGEVFVTGINVQADALKIRKSIGYLPENNPLYPEMYVREYLSYVLKTYKTRFPAKKRIDEVIELTGLSPEQHKKIGTLSKGYRQRVGLAQALIHDPPILILDEPTTGLDPNQLSGIRNVISSLGKEKTILLSTHIMQEVEAICDRVIILNKGKIVADDKVGMLEKKATVSMSYFLELKEKVFPEQLTEINGVILAEPLAENQWILHTDKNEDLRETIFRHVVQKNWHMLAFSPQKENLEDVFRLLTRDK